MTATQSRLLGVALLLASISVVLRLTSGSDPSESATAEGSRDAIARKAQMEQESARSRARFEEGAFVKSSKQLSDHEVLQVIVIPESYVEELDTRCVVYQNLESRTSTMDCSGAMFRRPAS